MKEGEDYRELEDLHAQAKALCHGFLGPFKVALRSWPMTTSTASPRVGYCTFFFAVQHPPIPTIGMLPHGGDTYHEMVNDPPKPHTPPTIAR